MVISSGRILGLAASLLVGGMLSVASLASADVQAISQVDVQQKDGVTRVILRGAEDPIYTAFMLSGPPRLLLDLPDVVFDGVETPIQVKDGVVGEITLGAFGDPRVSPSMARVSIGLMVESDYEVIPSGNEIVVEIRPKSAAGQTVAAKTRRATEPSSKKAAPSQPSKKEASAPKAAAAALKKASRILRVVPNEAWIAVQAEGPIDNVDSFVVHGPERLVVDFWGVQNAEPRNVIPVPGSIVKQVRVGQHSDKVRLVLDLEGELLSHAVEPTRNGVRIRLHGKTSKASGTKNEEKAPAAPAPDVNEEGEAIWEEEEHSASASSKGKEEAAKPARPATVGRVQSVHFESFAEMDRVVVTLDRSVETVVAEPDTATVVVDLPGTRIEPAAERRVSTREFGGPVQMMSAFQTPDIDYDQVRVVLKRSRPVSPRLTWDGSRLLIEMPRDYARQPSAPGSAGASLPGGAQDSAAAPLSKSGAETPAALSPGGTSQLISTTESLFDGPFDPASIDVLEEGGLTEEKVYQGRRISLDFKDADIGNILRLIADVSDLNIIAGEEVSGTVTIRLVDVPWDQSLDVILLTKGLGFVRVGKVLRIAPLDVLQREEEARLQERRAKERLEDLVVKLQPVSYASVKEIERLVQKLLSERGTVNVDERTNTLIIKDIPSVIDEATALIKAVDTQTPQVLIEAKIVEANLNFSRSLGAVFGFGYNPQGRTGSPWQGGAPDFRLGDGSLTQVPGFGSNSQRTNFIVSNPIAATTGALTMGLLGLNDHLQLDLTLQAAETNNKGKVISAPRVVTLNNREAKIAQGTAIRFDSSDGDSVNTTFIDAVLELTVTPHITADRSIIMKIKVSKNSPAISEASGDVVGINKNETETETLVFDGQTVVLGGIYTVDKSSQRSKVPFIADIPLLGTIFRNSIRSDVRNELLIFVTPRIVQGMKPAS